MRANKQVSNPHIRFVFKEYVKPGRPEYYRQNGKIVNINVTYGVLFKRYMFKEKANQCWIKATQTFN